MALVGFQVAERLDDKTPRANIYVYNLALTQLKCVLLEECSVGVALDSYSKAEATDEWIPRRWAARLEEVKLEVEEHMKQKQGPPENSA